MPTNEIEPGITMHNGTYFAEVPTYRNSPFTRYERFADLDSARAWRTAALTAIEAVKAIPDASAFRQPEIAEADVIDRVPPRNAILEGSGKATTVAHVVDAYVESLRPRGLSTHATKQAERILDRYFVTAIGSRDAASLTEDDITDIGDDMIRRGLRGSTVRSGLAKVRAAFSHAADIGLIEVNPLGISRCIPESADVSRRMRPAPGVYRTASGYMAQVPAALGSHRNVRQTFRSLDEARAWRRSALAALRPAETRKLKVSDICWVDSKGQDRDG